MNKVLERERVSRNPRFLRVSLMKKIKLLCDKKEYPIDSR